DVTPEGAGRKRDDVLACLETADTFAHSSYATGTLGAERSRLSLVHAQRVQYVSKVEAGREYFDLHFACHRAAAAHRPNRQLFQKPALRDLQLEGFVRRGALPRHGGAKRGQPEHMAAAAAKRDLIFAEVVSQLRHERVVIGKFGRWIEVDTRAPEMRILGRDRTGQAPKRRLIWIDR